MLMLKSSKYFEFLLRLCGLFMKKALMIKIFVFKACYHYNIIIDMTKDREPLQNITIKDLIYVNQYFSMHSGRNYWRGY